MTGRRRATAGRNRRPFNVPVLDVAEYFADRLPVLRDIQSFVGLPCFDNPYLEKTNANPLHLPPADSESMEKLRAFFRPHTAGLREVIGKTFTCQASPVVPDPISRR